MRHSASRSSLFPRRGTGAHLQQIPSVPSASSEYFSSYFEPTYGVNWLYLNSSSPKKFTPPLVRALQVAQASIKESIQSDLAQNQTPKIKYQVFSSNIPGVFNLGGDLSFFIKKIKSKDRQALTVYAKSCLDTVFTSLTNYKLPITTIALVQGTAMGGGFEAVLANNIIVAEKQCQLGFPEILFNMFPGMGAYQLLSRRIPPAKAESLILSGKNYTSEELFELGIIDVIAEKGKGEEAVWELIKASENKSKGRNAFYNAIRNAEDPVEYESYKYIAECWVEAAFSLNDSELKTMEFLVKAQQRLGS